MIKYFSPLIVVIILVNFLPIHVNATNNLQYTGCINVDSSKKLYNLNGKWFFRAEDSIENKEKNVDLAKWKLIESHFPWTRIKEFENYKDNGWYRINININGESNNFALFISRQYRGTQYFLNGKFLFETRPFNKLGKTEKIIGKPDYIRVPNDLITKGINVLAIRTGWLDNCGGIGSQTLFGDHQEVKRYWIHFILWYSLLAAINIFLSLYFLLFFLNRKTEKYYLYFSGLSFSLGSWTLGYKGIILWVFDYQWLYITSTYLGGIFSSYLLINFIHSFLNLNKNLITKLLEYFFIFLAFILIIEFSIYGEVYYFLKYIYDYFIIGIMISVIYATIQSIIGIKTKKHFAQRILAGMSVLLVTYLISIFSFLDIINIEAPIIEGFFVMTLVFATVLASRFAQVHTELEKTHGDLVILDQIKGEAMKTLNIYRHIVSTSRDQMAFIDANHCFIAVNDALLRAFSKDRTEVVSHPVRLIVGDREFGSVWEAHFRQCLSGSESVFERWFDFPGTGRRYMITALYPYISENGKIEGIVYNSMDITERVQFEKEMVQISENERRDIGIELHDGLAQNLLHIAIKTSMLSSRLNGKSLPESSEAEEIENLINRAINDTRSLAKGLFPLNLETGGFAAFSEELKQRLQRLCNISLFIDIDKSIEIRDMMVYTQLYYIIQEAVNNSVKHSRATRIDIAMRREDGHISLSVTDNGIGLPEKKEDLKGIGMNIMKYRARMIGAALSIQNGKENGTEVLCRLTL